MHVLAAGWLKASPTASLVASSPSAKCPTWPFSPNWLTGTGASALSYWPDPPAATRAWQTLQAALTTGPTHHHRYQLDALLPAGSPLRMGGSPWTSDSPSLSHVSAWDLRPVSGLVWDWPHKPLVYAPTAPPKAPQIYHRALFLPRKS